MNAKLFSEIQRITPNVIQDAPMSKYTTFKIGGPADFLIFPKTSKEITSLLTLAGDNGVPVTVIGNGSNLLVDDAGICGMVLRMDKPMSEICIDGTSVTAQAGASLSAVAAVAEKASLTGLEFASGIPGSIGGAICMNAGAYGGQMEDVTLWCDVVDQSGSVRRITQHGFGYRESVYGKNGYIILNVGMQLKEGVQTEIRERMRSLSKQRIQKQPIELPSAGSTFKRPTGYFAGALIEQAGLKGYRIGGAQVSEKHAGFIVNIGGATCGDVMRLIEHIKQEVYKAFGVMLEPEVKVAGGR